jgi:Cys-tRNA(Pro) deacylase
MKKAKKAKKKSPAKKGKVGKKAKKTKKAAISKKKVVKKAVPKKKTAPKKKAVKKAATKKKLKVAKKVPIKKVAAPKVSMPSTPAVDDLLKYGAEFTLSSYSYAEPGGTKQPADQLGVNEHIILKTIVMEDENGKPLIVLMHGDKNVSPEALAQTIGAQRINVCAPNTAQQLTGYQFGCISPFGIQKVIPVFMERSIADLPEVYINAGKLGLMAKMSPFEVVDILKPFMVSVAI